MKRKRGLSEQGGKEAARPLFPLTSRLDHYEAGIGRRVAGGQYKVAVRKYSTAWLKQKKSTRGLSSD